MNMNRRLAQLFRLTSAGKIPETMPDEYQEGWLAGFVKGRDLQRAADIKVAARLLEAERK